MIASDACSLAFEAACKLAAQAADGELTLSRIEEGPLSDVPSALPEVDLGHLSTAVDAIICRAILGTNAWTFSCSA